MKVIFTVLVTLSLLVVNNIFYAQQNLVPNGSFEEYSQCPDPATVDPMPDNMIELAMGWYNPTGYTPDYFNSCVTVTNSYSVPTNGYGYQVPRTGNAYCGIYIPVRSGNSLREYIQTKLIEPLIAGEEYSVKFYVSLADNFSDYSVNTIGAFFSNIPISSTTNTVFNKTPQIVNDATFNPLIDTTQWQEVSGTFIALGGERYMTIGNFEMDGNVDTTNLVLNPTKDPLYYIDDVSIKKNTTNSTGQLEIGNLHYYPNPVNDILSINLPSKESYDIILMDIFGNQNIIFEDIQNILEIDVKNYKNGIYLLQVVQNKNLLSTKKVIINH